jgi:hypothetical protein
MEEIHYHKSQEHEPESVWKDGDLTSRFIGSLESLPSSIAQGIEQRASVLTISTPELLLVIIRGGRSVKKEGGYSTFLTTFELSQITSGTKQSDSYHQE